MTSSIKPEVHDISQGRKRVIAPRWQVTYTKIGEDRACIYRDRPIGPYAHGQLLRQDSALQASHTPQLASLTNIIEVFKMVHKYYDITAAVKRNFNIFTTTRKNKYQLQKCQRLLFKKIYFLFTGCMIGTVSLIQTNTGLIKRLL